MTNNKKADKIVAIGGKLMSLIFICGIIFSILQSILFWEKKPEISVMLFTISFLVGLIYLMYKYKKEIYRKAIEYKDENDLTI